MVLVPSPSARNLVPLQQQAYPPVEKMFFPKPVQLMPSLEQASVWVLPAPTATHIVPSPEVPLAPAAPAAPAVPLAPVTPTAPVGPVGPVRPTRPVGPVGPCAPIRPVAPVGPVN